jgi:hypothetical protein
MATTVAVEEFPPPGPCRKDRPFVARKRPIALSPRFRPCLSYLRCTEIGSPGGTSLSIRNLGRQGTRAGEEGAAGADPGGVKAGETDRCADQHDAPDRAGAAAGAEVCRAGGRPKGHDLILEGVHHVLEPATGATGGVKRHYGVIAFLNYILA